MAAVQRKLVHKQFNSPMGLYSQQNVKETLDRELKAFGADGIEVDDQITKPLNLANSAVLRAVEEEEEMKCGYKRVAWPPVSEERIIREFTPQPQPQPPQGQYYSQPTQQPAQQQPRQQQPPAAVAPAQGPIYNNVQPGARQSSPYPTKYQQNPQQNQQPQYNQQQQQQQQYQPPQQQYQPPQQQYQPPQQQYQPPQQQNQPPQQQYQQPEQQPIQYSQAQFNRQPSREPIAPPTQQPQEQQPYQQQNNIPYHPVQEPSSPSGWKHIQPPSPKIQNQFQCPVGSAPNFPTYQPTAQQQPAQQQQYGAPTYNNYQEPPQSQPQYQNPQYQSPPSQQYQPPNQYQYQAPQQQLPQQQQQQPSWVQQQQPQYQPQQQYQPPSNYQTQPQQYQQPNQYNSYSQPQQPISQDQTDYQQQQLPQDYRGASPGIITLRKEAPVSQQPAPVYTSQPAAVSFGGGSNMRGDLKWPPPEYKEAAAKENEERRALALGPVCRPRKINRDYTSFFAKNALNCYYPSYKVPPGTQHMYA